MTARLAVGVHDCMDDCLGDDLDGWPSNGLSDPESDRSKFLDDWPSDCLCDWKVIGQMTGWGNNLDDCLE
jgi:hypothetical protein